MTERRASGGRPRQPAPHPQQRYRALQTGYREALLTQLDLLIGEMQDEGDFSDEQIEAAVRIRLEAGRDALRHHKLAEDWAQGGRS
ncbi:MAG TPA: hypothetical protein VG474_06885 [Solirubrobacteraceae bacterium]|nr:hypothetical protein [Solirubrobacteraceae bacterium]